MPIDDARNRTWKPTLPLSGNCFAYGRVGCSFENNEIWVIDNNKIISKKIKDFNTKETIVSYNFIKNRTEVLDSYKLDAGTKECYEIEFNNNTKIIVSAEHVFFDKNKKEIKTESLKKGDLLCFNECRLKQRNPDNNPLTIQKIRSTKLEKSKKKYSFEVYNKVKELADSGMSSTNIAKILNIKYGKHCYKIANIYNDINLTNKLLINANCSKSSWAKNYRLTKQNYDYMKGDTNPAKQQYVRDKLKITSGGSNNGMFGKHPSEITLKQMSESHKGLRNSMANPLHKKNHAKIMRSNTVRNKISKSVSGKLNPAYGRIYYPHSKFMLEFNHIIRSTWEENVCRFLHINNISYKYEPKFFEVTVNGIDKTYTPDIEINDNFYIEVKGPLYDESLLKMLSFKEKNPDKKLYIITKSVRNMKQLSKHFKCLHYDKFINGGYNLNEIFKN